MAKSHKTEAEKSEERKVEAVVVDNKDGSQSSVNKGPLSQEVAPGSTSGEPPDVPQQPSDVKKETRLYQLDSGEKKWLTKDEVEDLPGNRYWKD